MNSVGRSVDRTPCIEVQYKAFCPHFYQHLTRSGTPNPSVFRKVSLVHAPFAGSLVPSPRRGAVPRLPCLIEEPSAPMVATSRAAITFRDAIAPPSFPGLPRGRWPTPLAPHGTPIRPEQASTVPSTISPIMAFKDVNDCSKVRGSNGQMFNRCDRCNCDFFHPNVSLQACRHQHARKVLTGDRKLPDNVFFLPGAYRLTRPVGELFPTADDSRTFTTYSCQD